TAASAIARSKSALIGIVSMGDLRIEVLRNLLAVELLCGIEFPFAELPASRTGDTRARMVRNMLPLVKHGPADPTARGIDSFKRTRRFPMRAADVMTPDPVCVSPDASITDAIQLMLERKFSGLPVVDAGGSVVGVVTEGDLLRRTETGTQRKRTRWIEFLMGPGRLASEYGQTSGRKVGDVMTAEVRTVTEDAPLEEIVHLMERHQINRVLVVRDGKLVGIVTRANLLHALATVAAETKPGPASDTSIR